jgi:hypothetical protein
MPYPRPVSPHSLETCALPPSDNDTDDLIASDDELDDVSRTAMKQRIDKLAESYLQGKPLFILSASLRGPLDEGWENPWKKNRTHQHGRTVSDHKAKMPEPVVKETDLRAPRYKEGLSAVAHRPEIPVSSFSSINKMSVPPGNRSISKSSQRESKQPTPRGREECRSPVKSNGLQSSSAESRTKGPLGGSAWLKKDRPLLNFTKYDPPSSPTTSVASRHSDKTRRPPRDVQVQVPQTPGFHPARTIPAKTTQNADTNFKGKTSPRSTNLASLKSSKTSSKASREPKLSPLQQAKYPLGASLQIINSSSQLPRFEYHRWPPQKSKSPLQDESILQEETILHDDNSSSEVMTAASPHVSTESDRPLIPDDVSIPGQPSVGPLSINPTDGQPLDSVVPQNIAELEVPKQNLSNRDDTYKSLSKDLRFAGVEATVTEEDDGAKSDDHSPSASIEPIRTEQNTYEDLLPSAQPVPAPLGVSDRATSLHSTALPKGDSGITSKASPDTQLSTQAALLHAQKSFQDDLDSSSYYATTPGQNMAVHSPSGATFSANFTPFYRFEDSLRRDLERTNLSESKDKMKAMSTQFMLDAATPFNFSTEQAGQDQSAERSSKPSNKRLTQAMNTQLMLDAASPFAFSTEKKPRTLRSISPTSPTPESKRRRTHFASRSASLGSESTSMEYEYHSAQSIPAGHKSDAQSGIQQPDHPPYYPSTADASLPLALNESIPTTGQDGQGVHQAVESFNLSQAIADAGSWLQQSFDIVKDSGRPSQSIHSLL